MVIIIIIIIIITTIIYYVLKFCISQRKLYRLGCTKTKVTTIFVTFLLRRTEIYVTKLYFDILNIYIYIYIYILGV